MTSPVLTRAEAVEMSSLSRATIDRAIRAGEIPVRRIGRRVLIPADAFTAWLTEAAS